MVGAGFIGKLGGKNGIGQKTGIDLTGEADGLIPDAKWKKNYRRKMVFGKYLSYGYWPGRCPINSVAGGDDGGSGSDGGVMRSADRIASTNNQQLITNNCKGTGVSETNRNLILEGMVGACSPGGTAFPFSNGIKV